MPFRSPSIDDIKGLETAKILHLVSELNPDHPFGYILSNEAVKEVITWKQYIADARKTAKTLQESISGAVHTQNTTINGSGDCKDPIVVGLLGDHYDRYIYAVYFLAVLMLDWVVSTLLPIKSHL